MKKFLALLIIVGLLSMLIAPIAVAQDEPPAPEPVPAELPPADEPPVAEEPPADTPPADEPPADEPPADEPPAAEEPVVEEPPVEEPSFAPEPVEEPVVEEPVVEEPVVEEPVVEEPVVEEPVVEEPPVGGAAVAGAGAEAGPWTSSIYISNPHGSSSDVTVEFYSTDGTATSYTLPSALAAHGSTVVDVATVGPSGSGGSWQGAAVIKSQNELAAQVSLAVNDNVDRELYTGFTDGATTVYLPAAVCQAFDQSNTLAVQNIEGTDSTFTVEFKGAGGNASTTTPALSVKAYSTKFVDPCDYVANDWYGSATFKSANKLAVVNHQPYIAAVKAVAYEGAPGGFNKIYFPTSLVNAYGPEFTSYYAIQNVGGGSTKVTLKVYNTSGGLVGDVSKTLAPLEKVSWTPEAAGAADGFLGSATAEAQAGGLIAGITNIGVKVVTSGCPTGSGQTNAFTQPGAGAGSVAVPWVEYQSTGWLSFLAVQNIGTAKSGTVTVKYYKSNGTLAKSTSLGQITAGSKANTDPKTAGAGTSFMGSVEVTSSTAADQLVVLSNNKSNNACNGSSALGSDYTP